MENLTFGLLMLANTFSTPHSPALASANSTTEPVAIVQMATSTEGYVVASTTPSSPRNPKMSATELYVREAFKDDPILVQVARCESQFRQDDKDGTVLRGVVDSRDVGVMQINEHYHLDRAEKHGFDIYTIEGNVAYAKFLYEKSGTAPWSASKKCWSAPQNIASK